MRGASSIFLIGPMGSGKTAVGRSLARHLGKPFYDSDTEIVRRTGVDIPYIFEKEGESGFREREQEAITALVALDRESCWRPAAARCCCRRTGGCSRSEAAWSISRPRSSSRSSGCSTGGIARSLSNVRIRRSASKELMAVRDPLYRSIADITVRTDGRRVKAVAEDIVRLIR